MFPQIVLAYVVPKILDWRSNYLQTKPAAADWIGKLARFGKGTEINIVWEEDETITNWIERLK